MMGRIPSEVEASARLRRIENLLDQATADLTGKGSSPACSRCAELLAETQAELQSVAGLLPELAQQRAALILQLKALLPRIRSVERLLAAAAEFYRGWCAAGPAQSYPAPGYQIDEWSRRPALLAFEG
jgi:hypothetical protein